MKAIASLTFIGLLAIVTSSDPVFFTDLPSSVAPIATTKETTTEEAPPVPPTASSSPPSPPPKCPPSTGRGVTLLPNPSNCGTYYVCDRGSPVLMYCPDGLHFNNREKACDWPALACCDLTKYPESKCPK